MKRIFAKSSQQTTATPHQAPPEEYSNLPPSLRPGAGSRSPRVDAPSSPLKRRGGRSAAPWEVYDEPSTGAKSPMQARPGRRPKSSGGGGAYPSYGEVQLDSNDNRGGGQVNCTSNEPLEAVVHQKLPPRTSAYHSPARHHSRSQSYAAQHMSDSYSASYNQNDVGGPMQNSNNSNQANGLDRHSSMSRGQSALRNPLQGMSRRASQRQGRPYQDEQSERPMRRPSLLYGIDSGVHGGYASAAMANAEEEDRQPNAELQTGKDSSVLQPDARYIDRYVDVRTPQSVAIGNGVDRIKRKLFGRRRKDEGGEVEESEKQSSGEWARDRQTSLPAAAELDRSPEQGNGHAPWYTGKKLAKLKEDTITSQIDSLCHENEDDWDWNRIQWLCSAISHSEIASKEAARALRKEFKSGEDLHRFRAVRLWGIVCIRAGDRFRLQVANKKFLEVLEDLYFDDDYKASTKLRGRLLLIWSMLAYEFQQDQDLLPITKAFNKISPKEMPQNGVALDPSHELFNMPSYGLRQSVSYSHQQQPYSHHHQQQQQQRSYSPEVYRDQPAKTPEYQTYKQEERPVPPISAVTTEAALAPASQKSIGETPASNMQDNQASQEVARLSEDIRRLHQECTVARSNAQVMTDALVEHGLSSELVIEFAVKTERSQEFIMAQIPWASALADQSRTLRQRWMTAGGGVDAQIDITGGQTSREEALLEDLLDTHMKLIAATSMITDARDRQREEDEERQAIDMSMREQRMDRSTIVQETATGHFHSGGANGLAPPFTDGASSSRSASPVPPVIRRPLPVPGSAEMSQSNSKSLQLPVAPASSRQVNGVLPNDVDVPSTPSKPTSAYRGGPRPMTNKFMTSSLTDPNNEYNDAFDDDGSIIMTPTVPSAKALGKRRAMSTRESISNSNSIDNNYIETQLASHITNAVNLDSTIPHEQALRARPPPALPTSTTFDPFTSSHLSLH